MLGTTTELKGFYVIGLNDHYSIWRDVKGLFNLHMVQQNLQQTN